MNSVNDNKKMIQNSTLTNKYNLVVKFLKYICPRVLRRNQIVEIMYNRIGFFIISKFFGPRIYRRIDIPDFKEILSSFYSTVSSRVNLAKEVFLIFDHSLGGGANFYINNWIEKEKQCNAIFLVKYFPFFNAYLLSFYFRAYFVEFKLLDIQDLWLLFDHVNIRKIIFNELVSYPFPVNIAKEIAALKEKHPFKLIFLVHDYYVICPNCNLFDTINKKYCGGSSISCSSCLKRYRFLTYPYLFPKDFTNLPDWKNKWSLFLESYVDQIICFSNFSRELLLNTYKNIDHTKMKVTPHNIEPLPLVTITKKNDDENINIGILGHIHNEVKGAKVVREIARLIEKERISNVKIIVIGTLNRRYLHSNIQVIGEYRRDELPELIMRHKIDIVLLPSICPESFSYVVGEAMIMQLPIAVFDLGAQAERVKHYEKGLVIKDVNAKIALESIVNFVKEDL